MTTQADLDALSLAVSTLHDQCDTVAGKTMNSQIIAGLEIEVQQLTADKQALADHLTKLGIDADAVSVAAAKLQADK